MHLTHEVLSYTNKRKPTKLNQSDHMDIFQDQKRIIIIITNGAQKNKQENIRKLLKKKLFFHVHLKVEIKYQI